MCKSEMKINLLDSPDRDSFQPYSMAHHQKRDSQTYFCAVENFAAIPDVCAWPVLQLLKDGTLLVYIFNQPCHGRWEGEVECWASTDNGKTWCFRGRPAPHESGTNRMDHAVGIAANGDLVAIVSGYSKRSLPGGGFTPFEGCSLRPMISRSQDGGKSWRREADTWPAHASGKYYEPNMKMALAADGTLCAAGYADNTSYLLRSRDNGSTWGKPSLIQKGGNETALLHLGNGRWLAAVRQWMPQKGKITGREWNDDHLELSRSEDDGRTWRQAMPLSLPNQHPADLLRLQDGRILLTYGNRCPNNFGVDARFSEDEGETWSPSVRIGPADLSNSDSGYPSSTELPDGRIVTVYYASRNTVKGQDRDPEFTAEQARKTPDDQLQLHYEMRVSRWNPRDF